MDPELSGGEVGMADSVFNDLDDNEDPSVVQLRDPLQMLMMAMVNAQSRSADIAEQQIQIELRRQESEERREARREEAEERREVRREEAEERQKRAIEAASVMSLQLSKQVDERFDRVERAQVAQTPLDRILDIAAAVAKQFVPAIGETEE
jgi:hypothetical protein